MEKYMNPQLLTAEELGIKLEIIGKLPVWEASPIILHQAAVDRIRNSIKKNVVDSDCNCVHFADIYVQFPDGSLKRPDISIFCRQPEETEEAVKSIPEAVIEVISKNYEIKDLELAPPVYLANGVKDIVVFNPYTMEVFHFRRDEKRNLTSPVEIEFECGCSCKV